VDPITLCSRLANVSMYQDAPAREQVINMHVDAIKVRVDAPYRRLDALAVILVPHVSSFRGRDAFGIN
jgi:hypothetical protein